MIQRDYKRDYIHSHKASARGNTSDMKRSYSSSEMKPENMKIISVSPYRALVKFDRNHQRQDDSSDSGEDETLEESLLKRTAANALVGSTHDLTKFHNASQISALDQRNSPIRADSQNMRGQREQFLNTFNQKRQPDERHEETSGGRAQHLKEQQKIKSESEYLRGQREQFLNGFSNGMPNAAGMTNDHQRFGSNQRPNVQINIP